MDVGLVVNFNGLIAAAFALLAGVALAVELGAAPKKKSAKNQPAKNEGKGKPAKTTRRGTASPDHNSTDNGSNLTPSEKSESAAFAEMEKTVATQPNASAGEESIYDLQRTYVDGLLGPRQKYDVALAILNEYETTSVSEEEAGLLVATQAYLSATRTGSLTSGAFSFRGNGGEKTESKKQTKEIEARKNTKETSTTATRKTGERSRPATRSDLRRGQDGASKRTTTGDMSQNSETGRTARNTKRKNTRPE